MPLNKRHPLYQEDLKYILSTPGTDSLKGRTVLVTGATGLIGTQLVDALMLLGGVRVIACGRSRAKAEARLGEYFGAEAFRFLEQDVCKPLEVEERIGWKPDYIIPLASNTHPLAYSQYPVETMLTNIQGARYALELAAQSGAVVLYPSSVEIYGNARGGDNFTEEYTGALNLSNARSCYTESKRSAEALCQSFAAEKGVDARIVRLSRVFGPTMLESDTKASSQFIGKVLKGEDIVLKSNGEQYFSYTYVADAVAAILFVMLHGECGQAYNISCEGCDVRLKDFAQACAQLCGRKVVFDIPEETESRGYSVATRAILSNEKLRNLGFTPRFALKEALERTIEIIK